MELATPEEVDRLLPLVSDQRREEALRFKHTLGQFSCLKSYEMLQSVLVKNNLINTADRVTFHRNEHGKPSLMELPHIHFNISHCFSAIAVAVDTKPVGIDVESFRMPSDGLLRYTMNETEIDHIKQSAHPDQQFTLLWTKKEALYKYLGTGIRDGIPHLLQTIPPNIHFSTKIDTKKGFAMCVICGNK